MSEFVMVKRELLEDMLNPCADFATHDELRAVLAQEVGKVEPVAWLTSDGLHLVFDGVLDQSQYIEQGMRPLFLATH